MDFVTRKVCNGVARIKRGLQEQIILGNLDAKRDWGHAKDFVEAMWLMMQQGVPGDDVVATGERKSIKDLLTEAFKHIGVTDWNQYVRQDKSFFRPADVDCLTGDSTKIRRLGGKPKNTFAQLIAEMMDSELNEIIG